MDEPSFGVRLSESGDYLVSLSMLGYSARYDDFRFKAKNAPGRDLGRWD